MKVFTYNFYCRPSHIFNDGQEKRVNNFCEAFSSFENYHGKIDVVLFQELFDNNVYARMKKIMLCLGFKYRSSRINKAIYMNGGGVIFSRHLIKVNDYLPFKGASIFNAASIKGLNYSKIFKNNKNYHLCDLHLDSFSEKKRLEQMKLIKRFLDKKYIPYNEAIIIGGDWNIKMKTSEINNVKMVFKNYNIGEQLLTKDNSKNYTVHKSNQWLKRRSPINEDPQENYWIDFFVYKNITPKSKMEVIQLRSQKVIKVKKILYSTPFYFNIYDPFNYLKIIDMSDHYGVLMRF